MKRFPSRTVLSLLSLSALVVACGDSVTTEAPGSSATSSSTTASGAGGGASTTTTSGSGGASTTTGAGGGGTTTGAGGGGTTTGAGGGSTTTTSTTTTSTTTTTGGGVPDPNADGPYPVAELDDKATIPATKDSVAMHAAYPAGGPSKGPYPVVVVAHGFQLPASQYYGYAKRLASFGYVAVVPDYPAGFLPNNVKQADDLVGTLDWVAGQATLGPIANPNLAGATGHSLGGKLAFLAATKDARFKAAITLDPVDSSMFCNAQDCPDVSSLMGTLAIPTGVLGETTDAQAAGFGQACAPKADNFQTFYAGAKSPALEVEVLGANHMSFLDDAATCGLVCNFCNKPTQKNDVVNGLAKAFVVAFYERWLRGDAAYDTYLTGAEAQARYVATNLATIASK